MGRGTKERRQAGKDTARGWAVDMWKERKEWAQHLGHFLVSNFMTRNLASMPAGDRSGVGTARDILKEASSTPHSTYLLVIHDSAHISHVTTLPGLPEPVVIVPSSTPLVPWPVASVFLLLL